MGLSAQAARPSNAVKAAKARILIARSPLQPPSSPGNGGTQDNADRLRAGNRFRKWFGCRLNEAPFQERTSERPAEACFAAYGSR
jgi:hypothetical protein